MVRQFVYGSSPRNHAQPILKSQRIHSEYKSSNCTTNFKKLYCKIPHNHVQQIFYSLATKIKSYNKITPTFIHHHLYKILLIYKGRGYVFI